MVYRVLDRLCGTSSKLLEWFAGLALTIIMVLTGCDVAGRIFGVPVPGTYEVVSFAGGLIIGLAVPMSSRLKEQVKIEIVTDMLPRWIKFFLETVTRLLSMGLFVVLSYALVQLGNDLREAGEVSAVLHLPFYGVAYGMSVGFILTALILVWEQMETWRSDR